MICFFCSVYCLRFFLTDAYNCLLIFQSWVILHWTSTSQLIDILCCWTVRVYCFGWLPLKLICLSPYAGIPIEHTMLLMAQYFRHCQIISKVNIVIQTHTRYGKRFRLLHILIYTWFGQFLHFYYSSGWEILPLCGLHWHFPYN